MATVTVSPPLSALSAKLFQEIAGAACDAIEIYRYLPSAEDEPAQADLGLRTLRDVITRIGWLADMGAKHNGGIRQLGGDSDWLCSPALCDALSTLEIENNKRDNGAAANEVTRG